MTSQLVGPSFVSVPSPLYDSDVEAELEVDQLDSDSEIEEIGDPSKPSTSKSGGTGPEHAPGHTLLPPARLENMIQADGVTGNITLSKEALFVLSVATEDFIKRFVQAGHREASAHRRNQINYLDMAATTQQYQEFMFLLGRARSVFHIVLTKDALMLRAEKECEQLNDNPALAHFSPPPTWMPGLPDPMDYDMPKQKKIRTTNGKDHKRSKKVPETNGHPPDNVESSTPFAQLQHMSGRHDSSNTPSIPPTYVNGTQTPPFEEPMNATSPHPPFHYPGAHSPPYHGDEDQQWSASTPSASTGGLTGETVPPFNASTQNPGRTIYSQSHS